MSTLLPMMTAYEKEHLSERQSIRVRRPELACLLELLFDLAKGTIF